MTIKCLIFGCRWQTAVRYPGVEILHSHVCTRCPAVRTISE